MVLKRAEKKAQVCADSLDVKTSACYADKPVRVSIDPVMKPRRRHFLRYVQEGQTEGKRRLPSALVNVPEEEEVVAVKDKRGERAKESGIAGLKTDRKAAANYSSSFGGHRTRTWRSTA